jgi:phage shock protein PspC (stress-responsive transcriptional regulator)
LEKKLYKSRDNKMIFGVCGGIGEYFGIDPTLVRLAVGLTWCFGIGIIGYIIAALIIPNQPQY